MATLYGLLIFILYIEATSLPLVHIPSIFLKGLIVEFGHGHSHEVNQVLPLDNHNPNQPFLVHIPSVSMHKGSLS